MKMIRTFLNKRIALICLCALALASVRPSFAENMSFRPSNISSINDLSGLGMCIHLRHFKNNPEEIARLKAAGVKYVRVAITWNATETTKGVYDWSFYDDKLAQIVEAGLRPILILGYSNDLYIKNDGKHVPPRTPEEINAFVDWAAAATQHYAPLNPIMEIWNEADIPQFWNPKPAVEEYIAMARPACTAMRKAVPDAVILSSGIGNMPTERNIDSQVFLRLMMQDKEFMNCVDAVSIHPYRTVYPESILENLPFYNSMAKDSSAKSGAVRRPYVVSEIGYSSFLPKDRTRIDDKQKAAFIVRMPLVGLLADFPLMTLYVWQDTGNNMLEKEHRFGMTDVDGNDKASSFALQTLHTMIGNMQLEQRIKSPDKAYVLVFKNAVGERTIMAWHATGTANLSYTTLGTVSGVNMLGKTVKFKPKKDLVTIPLTGEPVYIKLGTDGLPNFTILETED